VRWTFPTGGEIISSPALGADGQVYFTSLDGNLYALNPDGTKQWQYHSGGTTESSPIVNAAGEVCVGSNTGILVLSAAGKLNWTCDSPLPMAGAQLAMAGRFYFSVPWGTVQAMTAPDQRLWQAELPVSVTSSLVVGGNGNVYAGSERFLYAIQPPGEGLPPAKSPWPMFRANARHTGRAGD
jgi:outer membrane protein assembly factor BamB